MWFLKLQKNALLTTTPLKIYNTIISFISLDQLLVIHYVFEFPDQGHDGVSKLLPPPWQSGSQYETHLQLGSDHSVPMTTLVRSDFTAKPVTQVDRATLCIKMQIISKD